MSVDRRTGGHLTPPVMHVDELFSSPYGLQTVENRYAHGVLVHFMIGILTP